MRERGVREVMRRRDRLPLGWSLTAGRSLANVGTKTRNVLIASVVLPVEHEKHVHFFHAYSTPLPMVPEGGVAAAAAVDEHRFNLRFTSPPRRYQTHFATTPQHVMGPRHSTTLSSRQPTIAVKKTAAICTPTARTRRLASHQRLTRASARSVFARWAFGRAFAVPASGGFLRWSIDNNRASPSLARTRCYLPCHSSAALGLEYNSGASRNGALINPSHAIAWLVKTRPRISCRQRSLVAVKRLCAASAGVDPRLFSTAPCIDA